MADQFIFKRYELKYLLSRAQHERVLRAMQPHMALDKFGHTTIRNIYYDTDNYRLIRRSIEKPAYKEKLRVRSYRTADAKDSVFVELKKKHDSIVYKRRLSMKREAADEWLGGGEAPEESQISREIEYFLKYYKSLRPAVYLSYEREAYYSLNGDDFRVTFDENIMYRRERMCLGEEPGGISLLAPDMLVMEIKCSGGIPLWMVEILSQEKIYKSSYSKYGCAYKQMQAEQTRAAG